MVEGFEDEGLIIGGFFENPKDLFINNIYE
jgi:hypothetical protein